MELDSGMVLRALAMAFGLWLLWTIASLQRDLGRLKKQLAELEASREENLEQERLNEVLPKPSDEGRTEVQEFAASLSASEPSPAPSKKEVDLAPPTRTDPLPEVSSLPEMDLPIDEGKLDEIDFASALSQDDSSSTQIKDLNPKKKS